MDDYEHGVLHHRHCRNPPREQTWPHRQRRRPEVDPTISSNYACRRSPSQVLVEYQAPLDRQPKYQLSTAASKPPV